MSHAPIDLDTIQQLLDAGYTVSTWCTDCKTWLEDLDLQGLAGMGYGSQSLRDLQICCSKHRSRLQYTVRPPSKFRRESQAIRR